MINLLGFLTVFASAYSLKGGVIHQFYNLSKIRKKSKIIDKILSGKILSSLLVFLFCAFIFGFAPALIFTLAWIIAVSPSMGEEHGAVGDYRESWGDYIDYSQSFGKEYGIKKALQRGVWMGSFFTLATGYTPFIVFSLLFVPCVWVGQSLNRIILKRRGWTLAEPIIGAILFGLPMYLFWVGLNYG